MTPTNEKKLLEAEVERLDKEIGILGDQRAKCNLRLSELKFGVKIGDNVEYNGLKGVITGFHYDSWPQIKLYKKDGTLGLNTKHCFDWEKDLKKL